MRIRALRDSLEGTELDGYLVAREVDILYITGFRGGRYLLIPVDGECTLYVYGVDYEAAKSALVEVNVKLLKYEEDPHKTLSKDIRELGCRRVGFDSMSVRDYLQLQDALGDIELKEAGEIIWRLRKIKDKDEIKLMKKAAEITVAGLKAAIDALNPGVREYEVAAEAEYAMRRAGAEGPAFETLVSSGPRAAYPHGWTTDRTIRDGELVIIDLGAKYRGYCSDLTRTVVVGKPSQKQKRLYEAVLEAQRKAVEVLREGVDAKMVDAEAREALGKQGYSKYFVHGLGHGVGLEIHEPPKINPGSKEKLEAGNVVTVEPGVYIPGYGGIRIEDTVHVTRSGVEKLTEADYELEIG